MSPQIILVFGTHARDCAAAIAGTDGIAIAAAAFGDVTLFEPLKPTFIYASDRFSLRVVRP